MKSIYEGITYAKDLPNDYVFGVKTEEQVNMKSII
jgi:hypothetical protein